MTDFVMTLCARDGPDDAGRERQRPTLPLGRRWGLWAVKRHDGPDTYGGALVHIGTAATPLELWALLDNTPACSGACACV